jgi:preprotein translocase subunit YajC
MSGAGFLILVVLLLGFWLVLIRPQRRRQLEQHRMQDELAVGDEIVTAGGVYGRVTEFRDEDVMVEIAPDVRVRIARRAIAGIMTQMEETEEEVDEGAGPAAPNPDSGG